MSEINKAAAETEAEDAAENPSDTRSETPADAPPEIDPIDDLYHGDCPSISGRSTLTFAIGRHQDDQSLHLRITDNSGKGMFCKDWIKASDIEAVVKGATELTSKSLQVLQPGRSINGAGFVLAVLRDLGYIRPGPANTRIQEHVPATTFEKVAMVRMGQTIEAPPAKPVKRKGKGA
jgi:hypothetical protein